MKFQRLVAACAVALFVVSASYGARPQKWQYTALGDSLAVGVFAVRGYVPRYQGYMQTDTGSGVSLRNLAQNGWTSADLLSALQTDSSFRRSVRGSPVVTWDIGGNDMRHVREAYQNGSCDAVCLQDSVDAFKANWNGIIAEIVALRAETSPPGKTIIRTMNLYNPYVKDADFEALKPYLDQVNEHIALTAANAGIPCADVYLEFNGADGREDPADKGYISSDDLHPNDAGHKAIADTFRALGYKPLSSVSATADACRITLPD